MIKYLVLLLLDHYKSMIKPCVIILMVFLSSCDKDNGIAIGIENKTNDAINNVVFTTTEDLTQIRIDRLEPKERVIRYLSMSNSIKDGAYVLSFNRANGQKESSKVGYYSNGLALNQRVDFQVNNEGVVVAFDSLTE